jgi:hypothetical protein
MWEIKFLPSAFAHQLVKESFYECLADPSGIIRRSDSGSYELLASTQSGAILHIAFRREQSKKIINVFHGRPAELSEKRRYRRRGK